MKVLEQAQKYPFLPMGADCLEVLVTVCKVSEFAFPRQPISDVKSLLIIEVTIRIHERAIHKKFLRFGVDLCMVRRKHVGPI